MSVNSYSQTILFVYIVPFVPAGTDCQVYDVIISSSFYETVQKRPVMKSFLLTIVLEGLEDKYNIRLSRGRNNDISPVLLILRAVY